MDRLIRVARYNTSQRGPCLVPSYAMPRLVQPMIKRVSVTETVTPKVGPDEDKWFKRIVVTGIIGFLVYELLDLSNENYSLSLQRIHLEIENSKLRDSNWHLKRYNRELNVKRIINAK